MLNYCANGPAGYNLTNSLRFRGSNSAYLNRTPSSAGNRQIMTYSFWVKRGAITGDYNLTNATTDASNSATLYFNSSNNQTFDVFLKVGGTNYSLTTSQVFRDPSAWYHIVVAIDTTQATSSNRTKVYVNGSQVTNFLTANYVPQNSNLALNNNVAQYIGYSSYFDGYMTEINFIDGQALTPSSFGSTNSLTGVWQPAKYTGTYGTNGFYLNFSNIALTSGSNTGLGKDYSGNGNYWNTNNISVTAGTTYDAMTDVPTLTSATVANYAVLNPTIANTTNLINANLTRNGAVRTNVASMVCTNGKYYFETTIQDSNGNGGVGVKQTTAYPLEGYDTSKCATYFSNGEYKIEGGTQTSGFSTYTNGDVIGIAIDTTLSTPKIWFAKNNTWQGTGDPTTAGYSLTSGLDYYFAILHTSSASSTTASANFGQRAFSYTPPTGYVALNTYNLPTSTIVQGNKYMDATAYTGTNGSPTTQVISSNFQPDFLWFKKRSAAYDHALIDTNRGITKQLYSNLTNAEGTDSDVLTAIGASSFTVGNSNYSNYGTLVAWTWKANGGTTLSNTQGSITSTVQANTTAGFSIVTYTGTGANATVGHGLGVAPKMVIVKNRSIASAWRVWFTGFAGTEQLNLNETTAKETGQITWNSTVPTSTVFSLGTPAAVNGSGNTCVAYCWAEIAGFSKFGSYTGNGSTDGNFVYLGFRPKFIMFKNTSIAEGWQIRDTSRDTYNACQYELYPNTSGAEGNSGSRSPTDYMDILSNGFKLRGNNAELNNGTGTNVYIYAAFAESPFKVALAR